MEAFLLPFRISNSSTHIIVSHAFNMSYQRGGFSNFLSWCGCGEIDGRRHHWHFTIALLSVIVYFFDGASGVRLLFRWSFFLGVACSKRFPLSLSRIGGSLTFFRFQRGDPFVLPFWKRRGVSGGTGSRAITPLAYVTFALTRRGRM